MLEVLFGSRNAENVLMFITAREQGYASEIAKYFNDNLSPVQKQLEKFENANIFVSKLIGRSRIYQFNPRYPFITELKQLIKKSFDFLDDTEKERLIMNRRRPRRKGKPL